MSEDSHETGAFNIFWEHKFILSSIVILFLMFILKGRVEKDIVIFSVLVAVLLLFWSLFVELPNSRYPILQLIGKLSWYIAIGSALFMGWIRWTNID